MERLIKQVKEILKKNKWEFLCVKIDEKIYKIIFNVDGLEVESKVPIHLINQAYGKDLEKLLIVNFNHYIDRYKIVKKRTIIKTFFNIS